jgi:hypothetical protein
MLRILSPSQPAVALALLLAAGAVFFLRGPYRELRDSGDFATVFAASRCWTAGLSPYRQANIDREYRLGGGDLRVAPIMEQTPSLYPPSALALVSIIAAADWKTAKGAWMAISTLSFLTSLVLILRWVYAQSRVYVQSEDYARNSKLALYLSLFLLLFSPVHTGLAKGQPSVLAISLLTAAIYLPSFPRRDLLAGLLLGLSCCIKPQIALPFLLFFGWQRRWSVVGTSVSAMILVWAVALPPLMHRSPSWTGDWVGTMQSSTQPGGANDPSFRGAASYQLVNLQSVVGFFTDNPTIYNLIAYAVTIGVGLSAFLWKRPQDPLPWLILGLLSMLVLLGFYHRYYDLQLLLLGTGGMVSLDWAGRRGLLLWILGLLACLSLPIQVIAAQAYALPALGSRLSAGGRMLALLALHHEPLCLLALALTFAWLIVVSPGVEHSPGPAR